MSKSEVFRVLSDALEKRHFLRFLYDSPPRICPSLSPFWRCDSPSSHVPSPAITSLLSVYASKENNFFEETFREKKKKQIDSVVQRCETCLQAPPRIDPDVLEETGEVKSALGFLYSEETDGDGLPVFLRRRPPKKETPSKAQIAPLEATNFSLVRWVGRQLSSKFSSEPAADSVGGLHGERDKRDPPSPPGPTERKQQAAESDWVPRRESEVEEVLSVGTLARCFSKGGGEGGFLNVTAVKLDPSERFVGILADSTGDERGSLFVRDIERGEERRAGGCLHAHEGRYAELLLEDVVEFEWLPLTADAESIPFSMPSSILPETEKGKAKPKKEGQGEDRSSHQPSFLSLQTDNISRCFAVVRRRGESQDQSSVAAAEAATGRGDDTHIQIHTKESLDPCPRLSAQIGKESHGKRRKVTRLPRHECRPGGLQLQVFRLTWRTSSRVGADRGQENEGESEGGVLGSDVKAAEVSRDVAACRATSGMVIHNTERRDGGTRTPVQKHPKSCSVSLHETLEWSAGATEKKETAEKGGLLGGGDRVTMEIEKVSVDVSAVETIPRGTSRERGTQKEIRLQGANCFPTLHKSKDGKVLFVIAVASLPSSSPSFFSSSSSWEQSSCIFVLLPPPSTSPLESGSTPQRLLQENGSRRGEGSVTQQEDVTESSSGEEEEEDWKVRREGWERERPKPASSNAGATGSASIAAAGAGNVKNPRGGGDRGEWRLRQLTPWLEAVKWTAEHNPHTRVFSSCSRDGFVFLGFGLDRVAEEDRDGGREGGGCGVVRVALRDGERASESLSLLWSEAKNLKEFLTLCDREARKGGELAVVYRNPKMAIDLMEMRDRGLVLFGRDCSDEGGGRCVVETVLAEELFERSENEREREGSCASSSLFSSVPGVAKKEREGEARGRQECDLQKPSMRETREGERKGIVQRKHENEEWTNDVRRRRSKGQKEEEKEKKEQRPRLRSALTPGLCLDFHSPHVTWTESNLLDPGTVFSLNLESMTKQRAERGTQKEKEKEIQKRKGRPEGVIREGAGSVIGKCQTTEHKFPSADGKCLIPVTLVGPPPPGVSWDLSPSPSPSLPCLLLAYGAYGHNAPMEFRPEFVPLLDRHWRIAVAHVRGGGELGQRWHAGGRGREKRRSIEDLLGAARFLISEGLTSRELLCGSGDSAGALLFAAAANEDPSLFRALVLTAPFVDVLGSMSDGKEMLTSLESSEWGRPCVRGFASERGGKDENQKMDFAEERRREENALKDLRSILSYSPLSNLRDSVERSEAFALHSRNRGGVERRKEGGKMSEDGFIAEGAGGLFSQEETEEMDRRFYSSRTRGIGPEEEQRQREKRAHSFPSASTSRSPSIFFDDSRERSEASVERIACRVSVSPICLSLWSVFVCALLSFGFLSFLPSFLPAFLCSFLSLSREFSFFFSTPFFCRVRSWQVLRFFARLRVKELFSSYPSAELFPEGPEETGGDGGRHREAQRPTRSAQPEGASACSSSAPISVSSLVSLGEAANGASSISVSGPSDDCLAPSSSALSPNARSPPSLFLRWQKRGGHLLTSGHAERLRFRCEETAFLLDAVSAKD